MPDKDDFKEDDLGYDDEYTDEEAERDRDESPEFDETGYNAAVYEYEAEQEEYNRLMQSGELLKGLLISETKAELLMFSRDTLMSNNNNEVKVTAREVQEAIKNRTATTEMLENEIRRINQREQRYQELDSEKVQANIHAKFGERFRELDNIGELTSADIAAERLLIFHTLNYKARNHIFEIFGAEENKDLTMRENLFLLMQSLTPQQNACMIRMALAGQSDSQSPKSVNGYFLYQAAEAAEMEVSEMETEQQEKANTRKDKLVLREKNLQKEIEKIKRRRLVNIL
jgi:hypothetical protein